MYMKVYLTEKEILHFVCFVNEIKSQEHHDFA